VKAAEPVADDTAASSDAASDAAAADKPKRADDAREQARKLARANLWLKDNNGNPTGRLDEKSLFLVRKRPSYACLTSGAQLLSKPSDSKKADFNKATFCRVIAKHVVTYRRPVKEVFNPTKLAALSMEKRLVAMLWLLELEEHQRAEWTSGSIINAFGQYLVTAMGAANGLTKAQKAAYSNFRDRPEYSRQPTRWPGVSLLPESKKRAEAMLKRKAKVETQQVAAGFSSSQGNP
jgi:hypothetical protein